MVSANLISHIERIPCSHPRPPSDSYVKHCDHYTEQLYFSCYLVYRTIVT